MIELPTQTIFYAIERAIKEYRRFAQRNLNMAVGDITIDQVLVLFYLNNHPEISQNKIAELVFKDNASITRMIELMIKKNYLKRSINNLDRRKYLIELTTKGKKTLNDLYVVIISNRAISLNGITKNELGQLEKTLNKLISNCVNQKQMMNEMMA